MRGILVIQLLVLLGCAVVVGMWIMNFPYPAATVRPFLTPQQRWPTEQVREWATTSQKENRHAFRTDFWEFFTRDPERTIPAGPAIVAPADGKILSIDEAAGKNCIVIALSFWDVHVQRAPCDALVTKVEDAGDTYMDGEGRDMAYLREKVCPVQSIITLQTRHGEFKVRLITSLAARRLEVWVKEGQEIAKGDRIGRILAGSTVVLEMPKDIPLAIAKDDRVEGGTSIISTGRGR